MQFNTFVTSIADLDACAAAPGVQEVLLEPRLTARQGKLSPDEVQRLAIAARQRGLSPVLVWDVLMTEPVMQGIGDRLQAWDLSVFSAIRVCDLGAAAWVQAHLPQMPLHLIAETGNHNREALQGWCELLGPSLQRLILSIELPEATLIDYCQQLPVDCEVLGAGPILLFYSPRSLLAAHVSSAAHVAGDDGCDALTLTAQVAFEDTPQRLFPTYETPHGTLMFLDKDQFILDRLTNLAAAGLAMVRLDLRHLSRAGEAATGITALCTQLQTDPSQLRQTWPRPIQAPFFNANRTTALFPRLKAKAKLATYRNQNCLAEVIAGESGQYAVWQVLQAFTRSQIDCLRIPTGEALPLPPDLTFRTLTGAIPSPLEPDQILVTAWIKKAVPGSLLMGR
ncbi:U32 family peptidase [Trichothermofontia sp.]